MKKINRQIAKNREYILRPFALVGHEHSEYLNLSGESPVVITTPITFTNAAVNLQINDAQVKVAYENNPNTNAFTDGYLNAVSNQLDIWADTGEPTGMEDRSSSTVSFNDATRVLTISPTGIDYVMYQKGTRFIKSESEQYQIPDIEGSCYIYYDNDVLTHTTEFDTRLITDWIWVATIYWNATDKVRVHFGDERHGITMDSASHAHLHLSLGAQFITGLKLDDFVINGAGALDSEVQFSVAGGLIRDEDIPHTVASLRLAANIPVL